MTFYDVSIQLKVTCINALLCMKMYEKLIKITSVVRYDTWHSSTLVKLMSDEKFHESQQTAESVKKPQCSEKFVELHLYVWDEDIKRRSTSNSFHIGSTFHHAQWRGNVCFSLADSCAMRKVFTNTYTFSDSERIWRRSGMTREEKKTHVWGKLPMCRCSRGIGASFLNVFCVYVHTVTI